MTIKLFRDSTSSGTQGVLDVADMLVDSKTTAASTALSDWLTEQLARSVRKAHRVACRVTR